MLTKMRLKNFKSWEDTGEIRLAPLTGFFGTNSSGKTSLLQALLLLKQTVESSDRKQVLSTGVQGGGYVNLGTANEITFKDTTEMALSVEWEFAESVAVKSERSDSPTDLNKLKFSTEITAEPERIYVSQLTYSSDSVFETSLKRSGNNLYSIDVKVNGELAKRPRGRPRVKMSPQKCYGFSDEALRYYENTDYLNDIVLRFEQAFRNLYYLGPLRVYPERFYIWGGEAPGGVGLSGANVISAYLSGKKVKVYPGKGARQTLQTRVAEWLVELGLAHSFDVKPTPTSPGQYQVKLKLHANSHEALITDMGIGVSQILPVLVLCYYVPPGSTIIFEQPELHLHPAVQAGLADVFIDVVTRRNVQIILESHSEHLLRRIQRRIAEETLRTEDAEFYFCTNPGGSSEIASLDVDMFGNIKNWPRDFFGDLTGDMLEMMDLGLKRKIEGRQ
jgi:AAA15 family ATPase/GTPase